VPVTTRQLARAAFARSMGRPGSLAEVVTRLGYVQADPIRAPARAQDLILRPRVRGYRAGDLERAYPELGIEEDVFVNYGFVTRDLQRLLHPRPATIRPGLEREVPGVVARVEAFVLANGASHPRELERALGGIRVGNAWGGTSQATTRALEVLHHRGRLRVARRDDGVKVYEPARAFTVDPPSPPEAARALVAFLVDHLAPLPVRSLGVTVLRYGAGHLRAEIAAAIAEAVATWPRERVDGETYLWPPEADPAAEVAVAAGRRVHLLAPFDPLVWDRRRFAHLWGWEYRFEAYTPPAKRRLGYYALPVAWGDQVVGWANASVVDGRLVVSTGAPGGALPTAGAFGRGFEAELARFARFLGVRA
jgi:uncharacterized protein YcaQ